MREIIVDRENGAKAFVLFELTKGNIAEIKDRYILGQLRSAIDSPWSTALPDGIRSALTRSVSEEMEDRFLLENMDKDTDRSVRSAIRSALIKVKGQHGVKNGPWADAYGDADVLDYAYQEIITRFSDGPGVLLDEIEIPEGYRIISGEKWASDLSGIGREWIDDIKPFLLLADKTGELMICDIMSKQTVPVVAVRSDFAERFDRLADEAGMIGDKFWTYACIAEARGRKEELCDDFFAAASQASQATDFIIDRYEQEVGHPAAGKEIVQKLDMPEKTEQEDRADRSLSHKKETARDASAHMQGDRADLGTAQSSISSCPAQPVSINRAISVRNSRSLTSNLK